MTPYDQRPRIAITSCCPKCNGVIVYDRRPTAPDEDIPIHCYQCDWKGMTKMSMPWPQGFE